MRRVVRLDTGAIAQEIDYDAFGRVTNNVTQPGFAPQPFGFAGGMYDPDTGLVHFGAREYDPEVGRWTTSDPIGFAGGLNLYGYCVNDPINFIDRWGWKPVPVWNHSYGQHYPFGYYPHLPPNALVQAGYGLTRWGVPPFISKHVIWPSRSGVKSGYHLLDDTFPIDWVHDWGKPGGPGHSIVGTNSKPQPGDYSAFCNGIDRAVAEMDQQRK